MIRRASRFLIANGALAAVVYAVVRVLRGPPAPALDEGATRNRQPWAPPGWSTDTGQAAPEPSQGASSEPEPDTEPEPEADAEPAPEAEVEPAPEVAAEPPADAAAGLEPEETELGLEPEGTEIEPELEPEPTLDAQTAPEPEVAIDGEASAPGLEPEPAPPVDPTASLGTAVDGSGADGAAATPTQGRRPRTARTPRTRPIRVRRQSKAPASELAPWVTPSEGVVPATHPVKAKMKSGIYHLPGMSSYERTVPDRCYIDAAAAEADGLRMAKR